ncbi:(2Fe-2S)-binding protein [Cereibacter sphaeroides]|nr:(2Fe-2S)-binding protein [Cereibacter sphaeroides]
MTRNSPSSHPPLFHVPSGRSPDVPISLDGAPMLAFPGETVAALLLRSMPADAYRCADPLLEARAPLCLMGVCFDCLVTIDGQDNQQACLIAVQPGMQIERQLPSRGAV